MSSFKRIIICLDGTMQDGLDVVAKLDTNIYRIAKAINKVDTKTIPGQYIHQVVAYFSGVGTDESSKWQSLMDSSTGGGLKVKIQEAYAFIQMNWSEGDESKSLWGKKKINKSEFTMLILLFLSIYIWIFKRCLYSKNVSWTCW